MAQTPIAPPSHARYWVKDKVAQLAAKPGEWEIVRTFTGPTREAHSRASSLRKAFKGHGPEVTAEAHLNEDGDGVDLWVRVERKSR